MTKKTLLITGGAGFVGSNLAIYLKERLNDVRIVCLDNLIRNGSSLNVQRIREKGIDFIKGDIRDKKDLFAIEYVDCIVECSAEPSVLAAYEDPVYMTDTNLMGTINCLELARRDKAKFIFLSTNRVYPIEAMETIGFEEHETRFDWKKDVEGKGFSFNGISHEFDTKGVRSLYGASKYCSELIAQEYFDMFDIKGVINRFGIIAGPWQMGKIDQGLVGFWVARHKYGGALSYIGFDGQGKQLRDAVHVDDVCALILHEIENIDELHAQVFNAGGGRNNSFSLCELTQTIQDVTNINLTIGSNPETRKSDVRIYITDNSFVKEQTGWEPQIGFEQIIVDIDKWIDQYSDELKEYIS